MEAIEILINCESGKKDYTTGYHATENFGVYREQEYPRCWVITHLATGFATPQNSESLELAVHRINAVEAVDGMDWAATSFAELRERLKAPGVRDACNVACRVELPKENVDLLTEKE